MPWTKNASVAAASWGFDHRFARIGTFYLSKLSFCLYRGGDPMLPPLSYAFKSLK